MKRIHLEQGTEEWLKFRKNHLGASDAPIVMGISKWNTPYGLWQEKLGLSDGQKQNSAMEYGKIMEEPARKAYQLYTGTHVAPAVAVHDEIKYMAASFDGLNEHGDMAVEIKNANAQDHAIALADKVPEHYYPQVQHQLAVLGIEILHYFSFHDGKGKIVEVPRDDKYIQELLSKERRFWVNHVEGLEAPELTDKDFVDLTDPELEMLAKEYDSLTKQMSLLEKKEKDYRSRLIAMAGGKNARGYGLNISRIVRKGNVDYKAVPELIGVDLEPYRKSPVETWRISCS